jgi:hypothetical protein
MPKRGEKPTKSDELEGIARVGFDLVVAVEKWLGTRRHSGIATDALHRLEAKLIAPGFERLTGRNLDFQRSILDDLERTGLRYERRDQELHSLLASEARCYASGLRLTDLMAIPRGSVEKKFGTA